MNSNKGLYDKLISYREDGGVYPFHMPGHKGGRISPLPTDMLKMDITELDGFDNLHQPNNEDVIGQAQVRAAEVFGAAKTFFSVNGSTAAVIAAVCAVASEGDPIAVARNCHVSVYNGIVICGAVPIYIMPEIVEAAGISGGILPSGVEEISQPIRAVVITSPTYEGFCSDLEAISQICRKKGALLIVDEAHGSHFGFSPAFPKTALACGADIVIQSVHKTLPSLTQTALLHLGGNAAEDKYLVSRLRQMLSMVQTTSPSYLLMASIDRCCALVASGYERFFSYTQSLLALRQKLAENKNIRLMGTEYEKRFGIDRIDIGKLVFEVDNHSAIKLIKPILRDMFGLEMEMYGYKHFLAMTSVADEQEGFNRLEEAIKYANERIDTEEQEEGCIHWRMLRPKVVTTPRRAVFCRREEPGISTKFIVLYPPGIPILAPGELITEEIEQQIRCYEKNGQVLIGGK